MLLLLLLTYLLVFHVAHSDLLGGVLRLLAARFTEADAELLLLALTFGGFQLRADDPAALRDVLRDVHARVAAAKASAGAGAGAGAGAAGAPASSGRAATAAAAAGAAATGSISSGGGGGLGTLIVRFAAGGGAMGAATTSAVPAAGAAGAAGTVVSRLDVLSELLLDLKNNRKRAEHAQLLERGGALRKWLSRLAAKTRGGALEGVDRRVRVGWGDIMLIPQRGRWWLVGASWAGRAGGGGGGGDSDAGGSGAHSVIAPAGGGGDDDAAAAAAGGASASAHPVASTAAAAAAAAAATAAAAAAAASAQDAALHEAASAMRMNTPARKAVFVALLGADDTDGALDRVLTLRLRGPAEREIARVLVDCAAQEAGYNAFYAGVGIRLCSLHPRFKFTFQLVFWDAFKTLSDSTNL